MAISKFEESVDIIAGVPTIPSPPDYTADVMKAKFDLGANKIKSYINGTLIPDIEKELVNTALGDGAYRYLPSKRLLAAYATAGSNTVVEGEWGSFNHIYEVVIIGGGGGGMIPPGVDHTVTSAALTGCAGGGGASVIRTGPIILSGTYTLTVGAGGAAGQNGGNSSLVSLDASVIYTSAGGYTPQSGCKIGYSGGIGGGDSTYGETASLGYGAGGDCFGYGIGAKGAMLRDDMKNASGYGAGGWGPAAGTGGAIFIYGYRQSEAFPL